MNILFLSTHLNTGGISRYIVTTSKCLKQKGHQVIVATGGGNMVAQLEALGITHITLNIRTKSELDPRIYFALGSLAKLIKQHRIDVIHAHTRITQVMGTLLKRFTKTAYVTTCHGFYKEKFARRVLGGWGDKVIAISDAVKNDLIDHFHVSQEKVVMIHNGIILDEFKIIDEKTKAENRKKVHLGSEPVIGIIARLADIKGHEVLIDAMKKVLQSFSTAKLFIIGTGRQEANLKEKVARLQLQDRIFFYSVVDKIPEMLSLLDVFVMPSLEEGFGLSILEAMAAGVPVVATNVGGIPTLIDDGITGLMVPPKSVDLLAEAIIILLQHKDKARAMSLKARGFVEQRFSSEKMIAAILKVYESAIQKNHE